MGVFVHQREPPFRRSLARSNSFFNLAVFSMWAAFSSSRFASALSSRGVRFVAPGVRAMSASLPWNRYFYDFFGWSQHESSGLDGKRSAARWPSQTRTDVEDFARLNEVYARHMPDPPPARSAPAHVRLPRGLLVSIEAIAVSPTS
jgi:hypothetical protein